MPVKKASQVYEGKWVFEMWFWCPSQNTCYTGSPHFIVLYRYCIFFFFNKLKVCGNPEMSKSIGAIFPSAFAHLVPLLHILIIQAIFQTFSLLLYLLWWSVITDLWHHCHNTLTAQMKITTWMKFFQTEL